MRITPTTATTNKISSIVYFLNQSVQIPLCFLKVFGRLDLVAPTMQILLDVAFQITNEGIFGHVVFQIVDTFDGT